MIVCILMICTLFTVLWTYNHSVYQCFPQRVVPWAHPHPLVLLPHPLIVKYIHMYVEKHCYTTLIESNVMYHWYTPPPLIIILMDIYGYLGFHFIPDIVPILIIRTSTSVSSDNVGAKIDIPLPILSRTSAYQKTVLIKFIYSDTNHWYHNWYITIYIIYLLCSVI